ncbi:MAG: cation-translocating P-type ATPase [bacterium]
MNQSIDNGLSAQEAKERLVKFGHNQIFKTDKISFFKIVWHEIREPMILLLFVVGFFYSIWGELHDALVIFIVIFLMVLAEVYNEFRAKKAVASLEKIAAPRTKVKRDGKVQEIASEDIVPGDILILTHGTKVAADAMLKTAIGAELDESALTGESFPQIKIAGDEIFAGTIFISGEGEAETVKTGKETKMGRIAATLKELKPPKTALQKAMKSLAGKLVYPALFFSILIPAVGILRGEDLHRMVLTGLLIAFFTIPEELPIIVTMVLGLGAYALSKHNLIVKKIKSAEILGNATCIVTDKTGTVTVGKMNIDRIYPASKEDEILKNALGAVSEYSFSHMEQSIKERAGEKNIPLSQGKVIAQRNVGNGKKTKAIVRKDKEGIKLYVSGSPEEVFLKTSHVDNETKAMLGKEASLGKRVIATASKKLNPRQKDFDFDVIEKEMDFEGLIIFEDPPRKGVKETIDIAKKAGIRTIMVTGDHPLTARYIAEKVGIAGADKVLTGDDLEKLSDSDIKIVLRETSVFARTTAEHKYRIVKILQEMGEVVAVTGDGINDVLALKAADIGIAMGQKGTDVAKDAAGIVLADDNYITLTHGIFEGRKFLDNLLKGVKYYLSVKIGLVLIFLVIVLAGLPQPFSPIQIIVLELFMDLGASAGFVSEPEEKGIYLRPPRKSEENMFGSKFISDILLKGAVLFLAVSAVYFWSEMQGMDIGEIQTFTFSAWIFAHITLALVSRSDRESIFSLGFLTNGAINIWGVGAIAFLAAAVYIPVIGAWFHLVQISLARLATIFLATIFIVGLLEIKKLIGKTRLKYPVGREV